ncbi:MULTISPECIES: PepSY domain-containing protein [unclassified Nonomuraea]|uniref:PepSY domain-containing protein n=1 Tax=unclassified Nonomuraea TaxID=2593643 RepID=UPI0033D5B6E1
MNKSIIGALVGAAVLAAGCGAVREVGQFVEPTPGSTMGSPSPSMESPPATGTMSPSPGSTSTMKPGAGELKEAAKVAMAAVPGSKVVSVESEENGKIWQVEVVGSDGTEHQVDVEAGKVVKGPTAKQEDEQEKAKMRARIDAAKLDYAQAADKIAAAVPEGRVTELKLETENGKTVWKSDVMTPDGTKHEVMVDAATGELTKKNETS